MSYRLRHYPYSGGHIDMIESGELPECRRRAANRIYSHRNVMEYPVAILRKGFKWELITGDDAFMVGDGEGILAIEEVGSPEEDDDLGNEWEDFDFTAQYMRENQGEDEDDEDEDE